MSERSHRVTLPAKSMFWIPLSWHWMTSARSDQKSPWIGSCFPFLYACPIGLEGGGCCCTAVFVTRPVCLHSNRFGEERKALCGPGARKESISFLFALFPHLLGGRQLPLAHTISHAFANFRINSFTTVHLPSHIHITRSEIRLVECCSRGSCLSILSQPTTKAFWRL